SIDLVSFQHSRLLFLINSKYLSCLFKKGSSLVKDYRYCTKKGESCMVDNHERITILTSGEIASLWETYQFETLSYCGIRDFLRHVEDEEINTLLKDTLDVKVKRIENVKEILTKEGHSIPEGFTEG